MILPINTTNENKVIFSNDRKSTVIHPQKNINITLRRKKQSPKRFLSTVSIPESNLFVLL